MILDNADALDGRRLCENRGRAARGEGRRELAERGRGRQDRVGEPDPHRHHDRRPVPAAGGRPPELLGRACAAELPPARLQQRRGPRRACVRGANGLDGRRADHATDLDERALASAVAGVDDAESVAFGVSQDHGVSIVRSTPRARELHQAPQACRPRTTARKGCRPRDRDGPAAAPGPEWWTDAQRSAFRRGRAEPGS